MDNFFLLVRNLKWPPLPIKRKPGEAKNMYVYVYTCVYVAIERKSIIYDEQASVGM